MRVSNSVWSTTVMPVILDPYNYELWLDPGMNDADTVSELLKPYDARLMRCYPVSTRINHVANDDEECSPPVVLEFHLSIRFGSKARPARLLAEASVPLDF